MSTRQTYATTQMKHRLRRWRRRIEDEGEDSAEEDYAEKGDTETQNAPEEKDNQGEKEDADKQHTQVTYREQHTY